jgi:hypothetical protein
VKSLIGSTTWYQPLPNGVDTEASVSNTLPYSPPCSSFTMMVLFGRLSDLILKLNDS